MLYANDVQIRKILESVEDLGIDKKLIQENCAVKLVRNLQLETRDTFAIVAAVTEKGLIGLKVARLLAAYGKKVSVYLLGDLSAASDDFKQELKILKNLDIIYTDLNYLEEMDRFTENLRKVNTVIDAMLGAGTEGFPPGAYEYIASCINRSRIYTVAIDVPTGLNTETINYQQTIVEAHLVVVFQFMKKNLLEDKRLEGSRIVIENVGIPAQAYKYIIDQKKL